jgi:hypothetical protein
MENKIQANNFGVDWIKVSLPFPCEIHWLRPRYDPNEFKNNDSLKVLLINSEPSPWCLPENELLEVADKFDLIIGKKEIEGINNITVLPFGGSFVQETQAKEFGVSNLLSMGNHGSLLPGHLFRIAASMRLIGLTIDLYEVYKSKYFDDHLNKLNPQVYPFISSLKVYPFETKNQIFKKTHNIAIENNSEYNYFTEKLIDCFRTFTVPIYWGCTNIEDHFDVRGMIIISELDKIPEIIESITIKDYLDRMPFLIKNYELSKAYWNVLKNIESVIHRNFNNIFYN